MNTPWSALAWFAAVLAAIPLVLWLLRRTPLAGAGTQPGLPRPVAVLPLSPSQRLVTIEVGRGDERLWLVLGVGAHGISTLHTMTPLAPPVGTPPAPAERESAAFRQLLGRLRRSGSGSGSGSGEDAR